MDLVHVPKMHLFTDETRACIMAQLLYSVYIGSQHIMPPIQGEVLAQLYHELRRLYGLS